MFRPHGGHHQAGFRNILKGVYMWHYGSKISLLTIILTFQFFFNTFPFIQKIDYRHLLLLKDFNKDFNSLIVALL